MSTPSSYFAQELRRRLAEQAGVPERLLGEFGVPERFVLWGGRVGTDAWVGSTWDKIEQARLARVARLRRVNQQLTITMRVMTEAFTKAMKQAEQQMAAFGKAMQEGGVLPPEV